MRPGSRSRDPWGVGGEHDDHDGSWAGGSNGDGVTAAGSAVAKRAKKKIRPQPSARAAVHHGVPRERQRDARGGVAGYAGDDRQLGQVGARLKRKPHIADAIIELGRRRTKATIASRDRRPSSSPT